MKKGSLTTFFCSCLNYGIDESGINGSGGIDGCGIKRGGTGFIDGSLSVEEQWLK